MKAKKIFIQSIPYLFVGLYATKLGEAWRLAEGMDASQKFLHLMQGFSMAFQSPLPSFHSFDLLIGFTLAACFRLYTYVKSKDRKKYRKGVEYGSARWGTPEDIRPFIDKDFQKNIILTQTERLTMASRVPNPAYARNKNVLVIGGSGSGKTRFFVIPNILQLHSSYVVTDPKGTILVECGKLLKNNGYRIKVFNTINFDKSHHYNPLAYIHSEKDILKLVNVLIANTKGEGKSGDDFWVKAETLLYTALISYICTQGPKSERNFTTLVSMINSMETREDDEDFKNHVDELFGELEQREPQHFAVRQYRKFKLAAGVT